MRYLARYIDPQTGKTRLGSTTSLTGEYKNDRNALKFMPKHLIHPRFPAGQYLVVTWPAGTFGDKDREVGFLYKTA